MHSTKKILVTVNKSASAPANVKFQILIFLMIADINVKFQILFYIHLDEFSPKPSIKGPRKKSFVTNGLIMDSFFILQSDL
jgi:hypothetical protein